MTTVSRRTTSASTATAKAATSLPSGKSELFPFAELLLDFDNPRLQTGTDLPSTTEEEVITSLSEIAALDELVTSICTNGYLNLEPLIVWSKSGKSPFKVLEGNRRVAAIKLILDTNLAEELGITVPKVNKAVIDSFQNVLVYRVENIEDARNFIGFKHINGPQRWDAYAKAKYVAQWYKDAEGSIGIDEISAKVGDNNNTLRSFIYAILALEQAEAAGVWSLKDRPKTRGRFGFSHLYTALQRDEYQKFLGIQGKWSNKPALNPIPSNKVAELGEVLSYIYGSINDGRISLIKSQNPDLKDIGLAIVNTDARLILKNRGDLDTARDALKNPSEAFKDVLSVCVLRLKKAVEMVASYKGGEEEIESLIEQTYEHADLLKAMVEHKKKRRSNAN